MKKYRTIQEGKAKVLVPEESKISKRLPVFYNPLMKLNRDISVIVINATGKKNLRVCLPLAGTGVRGIRLLKETKDQVIAQVHFNDINEEAVRIIKENLKLNNISELRTSVSCDDANRLLLSHESFDYIDIDPFGTPNPFLDSAVKKTRHSGILAVTATDTSALAGSHPAACRRKYWAEPLRNECMHETGLRILIRKVQLIGAQYAKALVPLFSYAKNHYYRVFFLCEKGKERTDKLLKLHGNVVFGDKNAGPLYTGSLWSRPLVKRMVEECEDERTRRFLEVISSEARIDVPYFYDIHALCKKEKLNPPRLSWIVQRLNELGVAASPTHFSGTGIRTSNHEALLKLVRNAGSKK